MVAERAEALLVLEVPAPIRARKRVAELAAAHRMPTMFWGGERGWDSGGLMSYGTGFTSLYPRMPVYVDRNLKGGKPADATDDANTSRRWLFIHTAVVLPLDGGQRWMASASTNIADSDALGKQVAELLTSQGVDRVLNTGRVD